MKRLLVVTLLLWISSVAVLYFLSSGVPMRQFSSSEWFADEKPKLTAIVVDKTIDATVQRAKRDYLLFPLPNLRGRIVFSAAWAIDPEDVYLVFLPSSTSDIKIVYRCTRDGKCLLWKAVM